MLLLVGALKYNRCPGVENGPSVQSLLSPAYCRPLAAVIRNGRRPIACGYPEAEDEIDFSTSGRT